MENEDLSASEQLEKLLNDSIEAGRNVLRSAETNIFKEISQEERDWWAFYEELNLAYDDLRKYIADHTDNV